MAAQLSRNPGTGGVEKVADFGMGKEKALYVTHDFETSLLPLVLSGRAMALLDEVVLTLGCRNGDVLGRA